MAESQLKKRQLITFRRTAHCGDGCQTGPCSNGTQQQAPGPSPAPMALRPGSFRVVGESGVPAMHAALMQNGHVMFLDKVENFTQLNLTNGRHAYSSEYDLPSNKAVPLQYETNAFCTGGIFLADGRLINVGGNAPLPALDPTVGNGLTAIRYLTRSSTDDDYDGEAWSEPGNNLSSPRWYASVQIMPDGSIFVASGSLNGQDPSVRTNNNPTFEILDNDGASNRGGSIALNILEANQPYYMYPFLHVLSDGSLFMAVSKSAELFNVTSQTTIKSLPDLPGYYRTFPNTGSSVLLPASRSNNWTSDIIICGGGAYQQIDSPTEASCGRIQPLSESPNWEMDSMPEGRVMPEGTLLPDGTVIWLSGSNVGAQGFNLGRDPTYDSLLYDPSQPLGQRFSKGASSNVARVYHSVALLTLNADVLVAGSNPNDQPVLVPDADFP